MKNCRSNIRTYSPIIYIAGPYTGRTTEERDANIHRADMAARSIALLGLRLGIMVRVLTPHLNTARWEESIGFHTAEGEGYFYRVCLDWILDTADAVYFLGPSPGANLERALAEAIGVPVLTTEEEVRAWLLEWRDAMRNQAGRASSTLP